MERFAAWTSLCFGLSAGLSRQLAVLPLVGLLTCTSPAPGPDAKPQRRSASFNVVQVPRRVLDSMNVVFTLFNAHWNELGDLNTLEKMLGTIRPTQREYLGCLRGHVYADTLRILGWSEARNLKQLPLAVTGDCDQVPDLVGTFHTHPYRADQDNLPVKERRLSQQDLETFAKGVDLVALVVWEVDSIDLAIKDASGRPVRAATLFFSPQ